MKRALVLAFIVLTCIAAFLSMTGALPFTSVFGSGMEPALRSGSLLIIEPVPARDVRAGDIIVYNVPSKLRDYYNYPPVVAHRVIEVKNSPSLSFRTKGDNTAEDPFTVMPRDLRGTVGSQIPYLGFPLLLFQSRPSTIFTVIALVLLVLFLYGGELRRGGRLLHRGLFAPVIKEAKQSNLMLTGKIEATEYKMRSTEQALEKFSAAIAEYAQHLASHTSAIRGLSEASHELKKGAAEQNRALSYLMENFNETRQRRVSPLPPTEPAATETGKPRLVTGKQELEKLALIRMNTSHGIQKMMALQKKSPENVTQPTPKGHFRSEENNRPSVPPGCARSRPPITTEEAPDVHHP